jgi:hypothetical protein
MNGGADVLLVRVQMFVLATLTVAGSRLRAAVAAADPALSW